MSSQSFEPGSRITRALLLLLVVGGAVLQLIQFLANRSLWIDEAALALNLIPKSFSALTGHLDYGQMAPIGFLWLEKAVTIVFGAGETALRLVPLGSGLLSLFLFAWVSRSVLPPAGAVAAVGLFAVNERLIYYSSEVKQYSTDVAVTLGLVTAGLALTRGRLTARRLIPLAIGGTVGAALSHPACFVLGGIGASMLATSYRRRDRRAFFAVAALAGWWAATALPLLLLERRNLSPEDLFILGKYWKYGFPPRPAGLGEIPRWLAMASWRLLTYLFDLDPTSPFTAVLLAAILLGAVFLALQRLEVFLLVVTPVMLVLTAAVVHLLPFRQRLMLFLLPLLLLLVGEFVGALSLRVVPWGPAVAWVMGIALFGLAAWQTISRVPEYRDELRPVLEAMPRFARPGDSVYVYNGAIRAFQYYQGRRPLPFQNVFLGCCSRDQWRLEAESLMRLGGRGRVWLILSQWYEGEASFLLLAADRFGHREAAIRAPGAAAYLYEFAGASADAIEDVLAVIPPDRNRPNPWQCSGGILYEPSCGVP